TPQLPGGCKACNKAANTIIGRRGSAMKSSLPTESMQQLTVRLQSANRQLMENYPGESGQRQPVHTVYGGAHLFKADSASRLGALAMRALDQFAPDFLTFARAIGLPSAQMLPTIDGVGATDLRTQLKADPDAVKEVDQPAWLAFVVYNRVREKLEREAVE